jgi:hypothetical protein
MSWNSTFNCFGEERKENELEIKKREDVKIYKIKNPEVKINQKYFALIEELKKAGVYGWVDGELEKNVILRKICKLKDLLQEKIGEENRLKNYEIYQREGERSFIIKLKEPINFNNENIDTIVVKKWEKLTKQLYETEFNVLSEIENSNLQEVNTVPLFLIKKRNKAELWKIKESIVTLTDLWVYLKSKPEREKKKIYGEVVNDSFKAWTKLRKEGYTQTSILPLDHYCGKGEDPWYYDSGQNFIRRGVEEPANIGVYDNKIIIRDMEHVRTNDEETIVGTALSCITLGCIYFGLMSKIDKKYIKESVQKGLEMVGAMYGKNINIDRYCLEFLIDDVESYLDNGEILASRVTRLVKPIVDEIVR